MANLVPVEGNPFADGVSLTEVEGNPFDPQPISQPIAAPRPSMDELQRRYRSGEMNPTQSAAFQELAVRQLGKPIETRSISYQEPTLEPQLTDRQAAMKELAGDTGWLEAMGISMGKGFGTVARGLNLGPEFGDFGDPTDPTQQEAMTALATEHPVATTVGETAGEVLPFLPAALATGGMTATIPRLAATTGLAAAEGGIIQEGTGGDAFQGAALGGAIGLGAEVLFPVIGKLGRKVYQRVMKKAPEGAMLDAAGKPTAELQQAMDKAEIVYEDLVNDSFDMLGAGSEKFDPDQLVRKQFLEAQGLTPSRAQVTREASDFQVQQEAAKTSGRARELLEGQEAHLTSRFNDTVYETAGNAYSPVSTVTEAVTDKATTLDRQISDLYKAARGVAPGEKNVRLTGLADNLRRLAPSNTKTGGAIEAIVGELQSKGVLGKKFKVQGKIDVETAEDVRKYINSLYDNQNPFANGILRELKDVLDDDVFEASGQDIFKAARKSKADFESELTRSKISKFDSRTKNLVRDMLENKDSVNPDQFIDKVVYGKSWRASDLKQLKDYIGDAADSPMNDLKAEVLESIKDRSFIGPADANGFKALSRDKLENTINKIGWKKLNVLFDQPEIKFLEDMLKVAKLREPVRGTALGKGPSAQAFAALEKKLKELPVIGKAFDFINVDVAGRSVLKSKPAKRIAERAQTGNLLPAPIAAAAVAASTEENK